MEEIMQIHHPSNLFSSTRPTLQRKVQNRKTTKFYGREYLMFYSTPHATEQGLVWSLYFMHKYVYLWTGFL